MFNEPRVYSTTIFPFIKFGVIINSSFYTSDIIPTIYYEHYGKI